MWVMSCVQIDLAAMVPSVSSGEPWGWALGSRFRRRKPSPMELRCSGEDKDEVGRAAPVSQPAAEVGCDAGGEWWGLIVNKIGMQSSCAETSRNISLTGGLAGNSHVSQNNATLHQ
jgi:hypothetical protein